MRSPPTLPLPQNLKHALVCLSSGGSERNGVLDCFLCCSSIGQVSSLAVI